MADERGNQDNQGKQDKDDRIPMPVFTAGERFKESIYSIGDITLFRPMSFTEVLVGMPICAFICYYLIAPLTGGTTAFALFAVMVYTAPKGIVWLEAVAGRPLFAETLSITRFSYSVLRGNNIYHGMAQLSPSKQKHQHKRIAAMLKAEDEAHAEIMAERNTPGMD